MDSIQVTFRGVERSTAIEERIVDEAKHLMHGTDVTSWSAEQQAPHASAVIPWGKYHVQGQVEREQVS